VSEVQAAGASEKRETPNENGAEATPTAGEQLTKAAEVRTALAKRVSSQVSSQSSPQQRVVVEDVPSLWTSVENGDTRAEVILANRYVRGEGVPQSCAQARVLLEAAVKRGSTEAKQKLDDLGQAGCP
jgi:TPR repeat protein